MRAGAAIGLEVVFFALAFGLRCWVQYRRTGSSGFILPSRDARRPEQIASGLFVVGLIAVVAAPVADLAGLARIGALETTSWGFAGATLAIVGIGLCVWAQFAMGTSWRIGVDPDELTELVTAGPFSQVRNPIFSAMGVAALGFFLLVPNIVAAIAVVALIVGLEAQVRWIEEPYLRRVHGASYARYTGRAGRFVPGLGR